MVYILVFIVMLQFILEFILVVENNKICFIIFMVFVGWNLGRVQLGSLFKQGYYYCSQKVVGVLKVGGRVVGSQLSIFVFLCKC